jgi:hypothetical protein
MPSSARGTADARRLRESEVAMKDKTPRNEEEREVGRGR